MIPFAAALALAGCNKSEDIIAPDNTTLMPDDAAQPRGKTQQSSPYHSQVFEYTPAPGQFINETLTGGFAGDETSPEAAVAYAERRLRDGMFVSLGAFGGYIVVGFDHSIVVSDDRYDFAVLGNAFDGSNEPGIVWVMQDVNGNGLPDDNRWYELRGSEYGKSSCIHNYAVTYFRPAEPKQPVAWVDSEGNSGTVDYLRSIHKQDYYYPAWIESDSYTLTGTCLAPRNSYDEATGQWVNNAFGWGYADNFGEDCWGETGQWVGFKISNAVKTDGSAARLSFIDFVKVQQGVQAKSGILGENSCEVLGFVDYSMASNTHDN